jgi:hypothetical protein
MFLGLHRGLCKSLCALGVCCIFLLPYWQQEAGTLFGQQLLCALCAWGMCTSCAVIAELSWCSHPSWRACHKHGVLILALLMGLTVGSSFSWLHFPHGFMHIIHKSSFYMQVTSVFCWVGFIPRRRVCLKREWQEDCLPGLMCLRAWFCQFQLCFMQNIQSWVCPK